MNGAGTGGMLQPESGREARLRSNSGLEQGRWAGSIGVSAGLRACIGDGARVHTITVLSAPSRHATPRLLFLRVTLRRDSQHAAMQPRPILALL